MPLDRGAPDRAAHTGGSQRSGVVPANRRWVRAPPLGTPVEGAGLGRERGARTALAKDAQDGASQVIVRQERRSGSGRHGAITIRRSSRVQRRCCEGCGQDPDRPSVRQVRGAACVNEREVVMPVGIARTARDIDIGEPS